MDITKEFHKMELKNSLFELGNEIGLPIWDIIRFNVFVRYYYSKEEVNKLESQKKHTLNDYLNFIKLFINFICFFPSKKCKYIFLTSSRTNNANLEKFDRSAQNLINYAKEDSIILEPNLLNNLEYKYFYDFSSVFRRFYKRNILQHQHYLVIHNALTDQFGECKLSFNDINTILSNFKSDNLFYYYLFRSKNLEKIFISTGNPKAEILAARKLEVPTYLIQHATIDQDEIDFSYPSGINLNSNILFADHVLTYGTYWCQDINIPTNKILPIGNDFLYNKPKVKLDSTILIISTNIHGPELKIVVKEVAFLAENLNFIFKLHPNEFHKKQDYISFFDKNKNVSVITEEVDTNILIAKSKLVVLISSAVIFEALHLNKMIAVYKKMNYRRYFNLKSIENINFFESHYELLSVINKTPPNKLNFNFFMPTNHKILSEIFGNYNKDE